MKESIQLQDQHPSTTIDSLVQI